MKQKKIVITGGPSTGKTTVINKIDALGYTCLHEISRDVTLAAREEGITQLFITNPLLFSDKLLAGRLDQFNTANTIEEEVVFLDRGVPDVVAYLNGTDITYGENYKETCNTAKYDVVFIFPPWEEIHSNDNERYEDFEEAKRIHQLLDQTYRDYGYTPIIVPTGTVEERTNFILKTLNIS
ncbi:AAA family ATPase [Cellulophaga fucicola]|uniref:Predicted ATPase n=1 Tax=Cellulophaga fucicola TaxID=76595 RepID=A0A1K1MUT8_9FLAO|nr:ATP-binding protein [Cellulophaga fucicola]SFW25734.1 Predicted ATPase [Cellulophaga fucicola]